MWYWGATDNGYEATGYTISPDGINLTKDANNPVLEPGPEGAWDELEIELNSVIHDGDNYQMGYDGVGYNGSLCSVGAGHAI